MSLSFSRRALGRTGVPCRYAIGAVNVPRRWKSDGKIVTISSGKGGVGKTTTAASFSYGLAQKVIMECINYIDEWSWLMFCF